MTFLGAAAIILFAQWLLEDKGGIVSIVLRIALIVLVLAGLSHL